MAEKSQREERFMLNRNIGDLTGLAIMEEVERDAESPVGQTESTIESIYQTPIALNPVRELLEEMRREREKEKEEMRERELLREKEKQERRKEKERERELLREKEKEERRREKEQEKEELRKERQSLQSEFLKMMGAVNNRLSQQESTLVEVKEVTINLGERMNRIEGEVEVAREQIRESTKTKFEVLEGRLERLEQQGPTSNLLGSAKVASTHELLSMLRIYDSVNDEESRSGPPAAQQNRRVASMNVSEGRRGAVERKGEGELRGSEARTPVLPTFTFPPPALGNPQRTRREAEKEGAISKVLGETTQGEGAGVRSIETIPLNG
ncbi:zinc finger CCCH domain-containing protein 18-like [Ischnura elegans]|uniref:zinc finger CCCH domain-containing protein 18-like n=1 Tax=Ischnura elegans TaxID=197161 RepID=UPI001ED8A7E3|nr:zinc finger CCCH domain-containing protein 18-like [Ischnura elegans]